MAKIDLLTLTWKITNNLCGKKILVGIYEVLDS